MSTDETSRVVVDSRETFVKMLEFAREYTPALSERIAHHAGERPLFDLHASRTRSRRRSRGAST
jgi:ribonuclease G